MPKIKLSKKQFGILLLVFSFGFGLLVFLFRNQIAYLQNLGYIGLFLANLLGSATILLPIPAFAATVAAGAFLNPILAGIVSAIGSTIGELTGYYAGVGGEELIKKDKNIQKVQKWMDKHGLWVVFVLAAIPNPLLDLAGIISGASGIPIKKYLGAVFAGKLVKFVLLAYTGLGIFRIFHLTF
jgi:uncharacterized membrane protein YdjX (TVP38/TMEM64 family)